MTPTTPRDPARAARPPVAVRVFATAYRGMAMGHIGGKVAFVPLAAPGDVVEVPVVREKRKYVETRLLRVLEPSPLRRTPPCPHFGACGGCQWQHLPYGVQLAAKEKSFRGFVRSRLGIGADRFRAPLPSRSEWGYRNRGGRRGTLVRNETYGGGTSVLLLTFGSAGTAADREELSGGRCRECSAA